MTISDCKEYLPIKASPKIQILELKEEENEARRMQKLVSRKVKGSLLTRNYRFAYEKLRV